MKKYFIKGLLLTSFIISSYLGNTILTKASSITTKVHIQLPNYAYDIDFGKSLPKLINNHLLIPLRTLSELSGNIVSYNAQTKKISITATMGSQISLTIGSTQVTKDEKALSLDVSPAIYNQVTYVPLRFVSEALGYDVKWDQKNNIVSLSMNSVESKHFKFNIVQKTLYQKTSDKDIVIASGIEIPYLDQLSIEEKKTLNGNYLVSIDNCYGEPHINNDISTYYIANNTLIDSSSIYYWNVNIYSLNQYGDAIILTDGQTAKIYNDTTLLLEKTIDLVSLMDEAGPDGMSYVLEGMGKNFLLVRGFSGFLTLIDTSTGDKVQLYKELLPPAEIEYAATNDIPRHGDYLEFKKQEGNNLYFENQSGLTALKPVYTYELEK